MPAAADFETHRSRLFAVAYRMLGSASDAEDAVQDTFLRWAGADRGLIVTPAAWLTTVLTHLCLNRLTAARVTREQYVGTWLPEPVLTAGTDPADTVERAESVSYGMLVLLERLSPAERAVFVLREAFGHPHREIAEILSITEASSQQLLVRARARVAASSPRFPASPADSTRLVKSFLAATERGDHDGLVRVLADDVTAWADGGGKVPAALHPVRGALRVARYIRATLRLVPEFPVFPAETAVAEVNGAPAVLVTGGGHLMLVMTFEFTGDRIAAIRSITSPAKLAFVAGRLGLSTLDEVVVQQLISAWKQRG